MIVDCRQIGIGFRVFDKKSPESWQRDAALSAVDLGMRRVSPSIVKIGQQPMPDIHKAAFLRDESSQLLALGHALVSVHGPAIAAAFDTVVQTRGLVQIAHSSGIDLTDLCDVLADPACRDQTTRRLESYAKPTWRPSRKNGVALRRRWRVPGLRIASAAYCAR